MEIKSDLSVNANYFKASRARGWDDVTPLLCLATQAGKMELLLANKKRNFFVSSESWNIVNTGKIYHLLNFFLFSTPFVLFFLYDFVEFRVQLLPHSLQLPVPRSHTSSTFAALCFPTSALFSNYSRLQFDKKDYWFNFFCS